MREREEGKYDDDVANEVGPRRVCNRRTDGRTDCLLRLGRLSGVRDSTMDGRRDAKECCNGTE